MTGLDLPGSAGRARRLVAEGLFDDASPGKAVLLGSRCEACEEVVFPPMSDCPNCVAHDTMRPFKIRGRGRLRDFAVVHRGAAGFAVPYVQSFIKLEDGPVIFSTLTGLEPDESKIPAGAALEMRIGVVKTIGDVEYVGWTFAPADIGR